MLALDRLLEESERIEPLPQVIHQLMELADDPEVPVSEITDLILYEPLVTANLLKLANSAAFGFKRKIDSVHDAVVLLGLNQVVEMVLLSGVTKPLKSAYQGYGLEGGQLWKQSVSCALIASAIAENIQAPEKHTVFTAALLKDIGVIVLDLHMDKAMAAIRKAMEVDRLNLVHAERQVLGIDHAHLGGHIAVNWNFSEALAGSIQNHHLADEVSDIPNETAMVYLADSLCSIAGINGELFCGHYAHYDRLCEQIGLTEENANRIMSDFYSRKEDIYGLLSIL